jgi:hypothetical protein
MHKLNFSSRDSLSISVSKLTTSFPRMEVASHSLSRPSGISFSHLTPTSNNTYTSSSKHQQRVCSSWQLRWGLLWERSRFSEIVIWRGQDHICCQVPSCCQQCIFTLDIKKRRIVSKESWVYKACIYIQDVWALWANVVFPVPGELCEIVRLPPSAFALITVFLMTSPIPNDRRSHNSTLALYLTSVLKS